MSCRQLLYLVPLRFPEISYGIGDGLTKLGKELDTLKGKFEVKLERSNTPNSYTANPNDTDNTITVSQVTQDGTPAKYKGFKHYVVGGNTFKVNRITIHGQVTDGIGNQVLNDFTFEAGGGVFVYFPMNSNSPDLEKPLLICLSPSGGTGTGNKWYKRTLENGANKWTLENVADYSTITPGTISEDLRTKLDAIKNGLDLANDTGYLSRCNLKWNP